MRYFSRKLSRAVAAIVVAGGGVGLANLALTTTAHADPAFANGGALVGVGSDTIQDVFDAYTGADPYPPNPAANFFTPLHAGTLGSGAQVSSFDAIPAGGAAGNPYCITSKLNGPAFDRPNGSGQGRAALVAAQSASPGWIATGATNPSCTGVAVNVQGQIDFARSSGGPGSSGSLLTFIPFARDGVSFAFFGPASDFTGANTPTAATLANWYTTATNQSVTMPSGNKLQACGIQTGSGTWAFWLKALAITGNANIPNATATCSGLEENGGNSFLTAAQALPANTDAVLPFSAASWISQANKAALDRSDLARAANVDLGPIGALPKPYTGTAPNEAPNTTFFSDATFGRNVFAVVITQAINHTGLGRSAALKSLFADTPFSVTDAVTTNGSATITSATAHFVVPGASPTSTEDIGRTVSGPGIQPGSTISSITNATTATLSLPATASATGVALTFAGVPGAICSAANQTTRATYGFAPVTACGDTSTTGGS